MWTIWKEELYKIITRKMVWIGILMIMVFIGWRQAAERENYSVMIDGQVFYGQEAIEKDKELTARHAGILTEEKVRQIYEAYGFFSYDTKKEANAGNFCSRFITEKMTDYMVTEGESPEEIHFLEGEEWERNAAPLLNGEIRFDYVYGWNDMRETHSMLVIMGLFIVFIIGLSPVFSEEYMMKTADILLTTPRGKKGGIWAKVMAALFVSAALYCVFTLYIWLIYAVVYGTQGLDASATLIGIPPQGYCPESVGGFFLWEFGLGLASVLLLAGTVMAVSALCRNSFVSVVVSLALFLFPYLWMNVLAKMLSPVLHMDVIKAVSHVMVSMPFFLGMNWGFGFSSGQITLHLAIALSVGAVCIVLGYHKYRNYQG